MSAKRREHEGSILLMSSATRGAISSPGMVARDLQARELGRIRQWDIRGKYAVERRAETFQGDEVS